jgi:hypothetical protein
MSGSGPIDAFSALFRTEHRVLRDLILDLIEASGAGDQPEARRLVGRLADAAGPHFRYEEERMYPALVEFFGPVHVESLCVEHDSAIGAARRLCELVEGASWGETRRVETEELARGLLPHVSDCEGLSILVERLPESEVARILAARRRAWDDNHDLLTWAAEGRLRRSPGAGATAVSARP